MGRSRFLLSSSLLVVDRSTAASQSPNLIGLKASNPRKSVEIELLSSVTKDSDWCVTSVGIRIKLRPESPDHENRLKSSMASFFPLSLSPFFFFLESLAE